MPPRKNNLPKLEKKKLSDRLEDVSANKKKQI